MKDDNDLVKFSLNVEMPRRWIPHFRGMLEYMQELGACGMTREITFLADGDGDFRPKFEWPVGLPKRAEPVEENNGHHWYDAG